MLYESLAHPPISIILPLPSAGLGASLALRITNTLLTAIVSVRILLIGIIKKKGS